MMRRRQALQALQVAAGVLVGAPGRAAPRPLAQQAVATPGPMAQIAAGGPSGLLGMSAAGVLFALPLLPGSQAQRLANGLDAGTPVAAGHGRVAARRMDGALWVAEGQRTALSAERDLAPAAGLLILPLAVVAVVMRDSTHHLVRLEPSDAATWREVARANDPVLPDAAPLQADLDGSGDGGHVVVLAGPDSQRYAHAVLGDNIEATRVLLLERHSLRVMRALSLAAPNVLEDIAPRRVALGPGAARDGLLTVQSGPQGAQLVLVDADPAAPSRLRIAARGPVLGAAHRWLAPTANGPHWLAVHTPHIGGVLHVYQQDGDRLLARRIQGDVSNHRIGSRRLNLSAWQGQRLLLPDQSGRRLWLLDGASDWRPIGELMLASPVAAMVSLAEPGPVVVLQADGKVVAVSLAG